MLTVCFTESKFTVTVTGVQFIFRNTVGTAPARIAFTWKLICKKQKHRKISINKYRSTFRVYLDGVY